MVRLYSFILLLLCLGLLFPFYGADQVLGADYPKKTIRIIVPFPPGAGIDMEARGIAPMLQKHLGVQVSVENVPGADGRIGFTKFWKAEPNGYTLSIHTVVSTLAKERILNTEFRVSEFSHICSWSRTNCVLVVNSEKWKTFDEFKKAGQKDMLNGGISGRGTASHLNGLILVDGLDIKVNWVPFQGGAQALTALAGNHIDFSIVATTSGQPLVKAGKLRALLVLADGKDMVFPDVPVPKDLGLKFPIISVIRGAEGPPKMSPEIVKILEGAFAKAVKEPEYQSWSKSRMIETVFLGSQEYRKTVEIQQKEIDRYKELLKDTN